MSGEIKTMELNKEAVMEAFEEAIENVKAEEGFNDTENGNAETTAPALPNGNEDTVDVNVEDKVDEKVEEAVDKTGKFEFLGVKVEINKNKDDETKYDITLKKDDFEKTDTIDDVSLQVIFDSIDGFFNEMVIEEQSEMIDNKTEDDQKDKEDNDTAETDEEKKDEEPVEECGVVSNEIKNKLSINDLRKKYANKVNEIFECGLEAKAIALGMVKDTILANSVTELVKKVEAKDKEYALKQEEIKSATQNYVLATKVNNELNTFYNTLVANVKTVKDNLSNGIISQNVAEKTLSRYNTIVSKIISAKKYETILAGVEELDNTHNVLLAHINKINSKSKGIVSSKEEMNKETILANAIKNIRKNKLNSNSERFERPTSVIRRKSVLSDSRYDEGKMIGSPLLSRKYENYDAVDEMTAEIIRIAGY